MNEGVVWLLLLVGECDWSSDCKGWDEDSFCYCLFWGELIYNLLLVNSSLLTFEGFALSIDFCSTLTFSLSFFILELFA